MKHLIMVILIIRLQKMHMINTMNVYTYKHIAKIKAIFILIIQAIIKWQSAEWVLALNKDKLSGMCLITDCNNAWLQNLTSITKT